ncbi:glycoside hydrolase family 97 protein [Kordia sp. YSTF-M3]|uniref:Glycoside hydrolase family 97 protein n=1 Tax=Kordia aestuariivivens TaxID=2759037 RepID=A0ABR7QEM7_9FLAO|nr:glycoside hydrolase family 97 protein [Kordia aestuariivivens]MBC8757016.1 glycoside hydrolase family 97 protein [Kordia aestuariivivens]
MKTIFKAILFLGIYCFISCDKETTAVTISSPDEKLKVAVFLSEKGVAQYTIIRDTKTVIDTSSLGFDLKDMPSLHANFKIVKTLTKTVDETWKMPWGEQENVRNQYKKLTVELQEKDSLQRKLNLVFKVYNDGIGFRYEIPSQEHLKEVIITDENTQFQLTGDHTSWWIPGDWDIYEHLYTTSKISKIDALSKANHGSLAQTYIPENAVNTPVTMRTADGLHISIHEAALIDYSGMTLKVDTENLSLQSELVGSERTKYKVKRTTPFTTPWRTIQVTEKATELIDSKLIVNLNEPSKIDDISWFTPMKYTGIWWEMHLGKSSWDKAAGKHGATTENAKAFIDFSTKNNIGGVLIEGWNTGWEHWIGFEDREGVFDFITPYDDYDLEEVVRYANEKGVEIIMHHETSAAIGTYDKQMDKAYKLMQDLGIHSVKSGYVGKIIPKGEYHHGQWMVNHYNNAVIKAIDYEVAVNAHEPIKATGLRRTYPNIISREGLRGQEFNAWAADGGNPPEHLPIVAFTRMLAGPIDYTPGIFNIKLTPYKEDNQVNTTIAQQLALYVVIYSPIQMAADLIENYEGNPALQFIRDVGVDWKQTKVINGEIGDFVTIAREERNTGNWFLGSITDENPRELNVSLDFLESNTTYTATIYKDAEDAHWNDNPTAIVIETMEVTSETNLNLKLAAGGGTAISFLKK